MSGRHPSHSRPVARILSESNVLEPLMTAHFDGGASYNPDDPSRRAIQEFRWEVVTLPHGSTSALQSDGSQASLFIDLAGAYTVELVVVDRDGLQSDPAQFPIDAVP